MRTGGGPGGRGRSARTGRRGGPPVCRACAGSASAAFSRSGAHSTSLAGDPASSTSPPYASDLRSKGVAKRLGETSTDHWADRCAKVARCWWSAYRVSARPAPKRPSGVPCQVWTTLCPGRRSNHAGSCPSVTIHRERASASYHAALCTGTARAPGGTGVVRPGAVPVTHRCSVSVPRRTSSACTARGESPPGRPRRGRCPGAGGPRWCAARGGTRRAGAVCCTRSARRPGPPERQDGQPVAVRRSRARRSRRRGGARRREVRTRTGWPSRWRPQSAFGGGGAIRAEKRPVRGLRR